MKDKYPKTYKLLNDYLDIKIGNISLSCPYWMNRLDKGIRGPYSGKATPGQIRAWIRGKTKDKKLTKQQLFTLLKQSRVGVDCSGFVFHLANALDKEKGGNGIVDDLYGSTHLPDWRVAWRCGAACLTDKQKTKKVVLKDAAIGDLIRVNNGSHVMVVIGVDKNKIIYAHSSEKFTKHQGVHTGIIKIVDWNKDLHQQQWMEESIEGKSIAKYYYDPSRGDSIRRFKWW